MPVNTVHPEYEARADDWQMIRDSLEGERPVKARKDKYLPVPPGMESGQGDFLESGKRVRNTRYMFYLSFAEFPELIAPTLNGFQGIIHGNDPHVKLPPELEYLIEDATPTGDSLNALWRVCTRELLAGGRFGILLDVNELDQIRMIGYSTENIINWSPGQFVVLREVEMVPSEEDRYKLEQQVRYRELTLDAGVYSSVLWEESKGEGSGGSDGLVEIQRTTPQLFGRPFTQIPLLVMNPKNVGFQYEPIPMLPLVRRAMSIYRLSADYRRSLYIKGDPQVVITGIHKDQAPAVIGGDTIWCLPNPQAKAMYLDIDGQGIPLVKEAISDEYERFYQEGGKLLDTAERGAESGEALRRRQVAQQVSLRDVAKNAGEAFQDLLEMVAVMMGADPNLVEFRPDLDFAEPILSGRDLMEIMTAKSMGAPLSEESIHALQRRGGLTNKTYEDEKEVLGRETPVLPVVTPDPEVEGDGGDGE